VSGEELNSVLRLPVQVLHPAAGLVGYSQDDELRAA
jgi:hypothetical protein